ncbi:MAG: glucosaminidase domain-containing protein [Proteobacteria bacterium]|nr:glucosaminidase domain-containing protein [Pseudomonadota bacterium]
MRAFEKSTISLLGLSVAGVIALALLNPIDGQTVSPQADFAESVADFETAAGPLPIMTRRARSGSFGGTSGLTVSKLAQTFSNYDYYLDTVRSGHRDVPPLFIVSLPSDMPRIRAPEQRKNIFFKTVLPLILKVNGEISADRERLTKIRAAALDGKAIPAVDRLWLAAMAERFRVKSGRLGELQRRMDSVPPSLAMAQAAEESGWGTSRFALEGNALFGQWTFSSVGGIVPKGREEGLNHSIKAFDQLLDAVRAYVHNLNTHKAYREFRQERAALRSQGTDLNGEALAGSMVRYSERGDKYVRTIRTIIRTNKLLDFDGLSLSDKIVTVSDGPAI